MADTTENIIKTSPIKRVMISKITPMVVFDDWIVVSTEAIDTDTVLSFIQIGLYITNV